MSEYICNMGNPHDNGIGEIVQTCEKKERVIRCLDCRFFEPEFVYEEPHEEVHCSEFLTEPPGCGRFHSNHVEPDGFCAWAEPREAIR